MPQDTKNQWPLYLAMTGQGAATKNDTYSMLIDLLRSNDPLTPQLREAMANALVAGQIGEGRVRLKVEGEGDHFNARTTTETRRRLLEAGHFIEKQRAILGSYQKVYPDIRARFNVEDAADYSRRAREVYKSFLSFIRSDHPHAKAISKMAETPDPLDDDDCLTLAFWYFSDPVKVFDGEVGEA